MTDLRFRSLASWNAVLALVALVAFARDANAAAEVHRFNLVISAIPTEVKGGDYNLMIDTINETALNPQGLEGLKRITFAWLFDAEMRYFVRPNVAVSAGVGQMRQTTDREYLPVLEAAVQLHGEVLSVPIHAGAAYYLAPYNQGDFQARMYLGAGVLSLVYNKALLQQQAVNLPGVPSAFVAGTQDGPGWYGEIGGHMFFAARYSVLLSGVYRSAKVDRLVDRETGAPFLDARGEPFSLDLSGIGARLALAIGF